MAQSEGAQAGLFSAVSSAFIIDVQSKLEPDPNDLTAAYMRILIHNVNNSLFPDADPNHTTWTNPPSEIVTVQSLLYASLATSLFSAFLAMLGKQWVNRYLRNRGGSVADKSRDRQRKLDGLQEWNFHLAIESVPIMLQLALLLLGCALSHYLWTTSHAVAGVVITIMLFGVTSYIFLTSAAILYYNCPYQTPPSILTRTAIRYLMQSNTAFARLARSLITPFPSVKTIGRIIGKLRPGARSALKSLNCIPTGAEETEHIQLAVVMAPPTRIFEDVPIDLVVSKEDIRCISWVLYSTTDTDVIFSTVRFAADIIWYPEIVGALSPHTLVDLFFDCLVDGRVVPSKLEHASSIGMALSSLLSVHLIIEPKSQALKELCGRILSVRIPSPEPTFMLVTDVLRFVADTVGRPMFKSWELLESIPDHLSTTQKLWLSRVILQTLWRWRRILEPTRILRFPTMRPICQRFASSNDQTFPIPKTNCFLMMAISLGLQIDIRDLYAPNTEYVVHLVYHGFCSLCISHALRVAVNLFLQQLRMCIRERRVEQSYLPAVLSALAHLSPFQVLGDGEPGVSLISDLLRSGYAEVDRYRMASEVVRPLGKWFDSTPYPVVRRSWVPTLLDFLALCEKFYHTESPPHPGFIALRILSASPGYHGFCGTVLPILTSTLLPTHPLQSRSLALRIFNGLKVEWFSSQAENIISWDLNELLRAVGDPFQFPDLSLQDGKPVVVTGYKPMVAAVVLIEFASLDLWRNHLRHSNFTSCEEIMSTKDGKMAALNCMFDLVTCSRLELLHTPAKMIAAIRRLEDLQCLNTAEVVILWAWTTGVVNPIDHGAWELIVRCTLRFYQTHGIRRLAALSQHITDTTMATMHIELLVKRYGDTPCRTRRPPTSVIRRSDFADLCISQVCQLRRLYHQLWCEPVTRGDTDG